MQIASTSDLHYEVRFTSTFGASVSQNRPPDSDVQSGMLSDPAKKRAKIFCFVGRLKWALFLAFRVLERPIEVQVDGRM